MKSLLKVMLLILSLLAFSGCLPTYYYGYMGNTHSPILNSPKKGLTHYLGGSVSFCGASNEYENNLAIKMQYQGNYTKKWYSMSLHADAYKGFHSVEAIDEYQGKAYDYYGFVPQVSASVFYPFKKSRLGVYGYAAEFWEFGPYTDWLKKAATDSLLFIESKDFNGKKIHGGGGILYEIISREDYMVSIQLGVGVPGLVNGSINIHNGKNVFSIGLGSGLSFGYSRALWW